MVEEKGALTMISLTSAAADTSDTWDATGYFSTIWGVYLCDSTGAVKPVTFSALTVTLGSITQGVHAMRVWGI